MKWLKRILIAVLSVVFVFSAVKVGINLYQNNKTEEYNKMLQQEFVTTVTPPSDLEEIGQEPREAAPVSVDFARLLKENEDIVGWLYCPNTPINYPVVKGEDNSEYLRKAIDGSYLKSGSLFADYRNADIGDDNNYIIYGHNTSGKTMFGTLAEYKKQEYYDEHPVIYLLTPQKNYKIEIVSGNIIHRSSDFYRPDVNMQVVLQNYLKDSTFKSNVETAEGDKYVSLSTCVWDFTDARYVVIGKITEIE